MIPTCVNCFCRYRQTPMDILNIKSIYGLVQRLLGKTSGQRRRFTTTRAAALNRDWCSAMSDFNFTRDIYGGIVISSSENQRNTSADQLSEQLKSSLVAWRSAGIRGVWVKIALTDSWWVPACAANGFQFHNARNDQVTMITWLPADEPCALPQYPFTNVGVGGLIIDSIGRVLLMREKRGAYLGWKYPGGLAEPGEDLFDTAIRETFEETGVRCEALSVLTFRHQHQFWWPGTSDFYFICLLKPADETSVEPLAETNEAAACRWFTRDQITQLPAEQFRDFHHDILKKYDSLKAKQVLGLTPKSVEMKEAKRRWKMYFYSDSSDRSVANM